MRIRILFHTRPENTCENIALLFYRTEKDVHCWVPWNYWGRHLINDIFVSDWKRAKVVGRDSFFILSAGSSIHVLLNKKTNLSVEQSMLSVYTLFVLLEFAEVWHLSIHKVWEKQGDLSCVVKGQEEILLLHHSSQQHMLEIRLIELS